MTLAELQPHVERAVTALEWSLARARWKQGLLEEREALTKALPLAGTYGIEREPLEARLVQIAYELEHDVTADCVSVLPLRSVPMDLITVAVVRRILGIPADFPILSIKQLPTTPEIEAAVRAIAAKWRTPWGQSDDDVTRVVSHV